MDDYGRAALKSVGTGGVKPAEVAGTPLISIAIVSAAWMEPSTAREIRHRGLSQSRTQLLRLNGLVPPSAQPKKE